MAVGCGLGSPLSFACQCHVPIAPAGAKNRMGRVVMVKVRIG